ncbi:Gfo/Idh/MocA family protein [Defluviimonas sp. SAOS-178_SWC]|uniref:Gfo/Idh/MocA family protein n=1 Tax=Defluviimonas sp. SAOS-178_SWC TaxID=3121287 RepID=UPI003221AF40
MKIALVGIGKIARDQHIPAIAASADWDLAATVSRHGAVEGVESFSDFDAMLSARPDIPAVSLCLPPVPRFDYAAAALRAGRHVMLEKPPGATLSECHALEAMARDRGLSLYATWHSREAAQVAPAKAWLAGKTIRQARVTWKEDVRRWHPGQDWIWRPGGLGVFDPGINALSILTEILPEPVHLTRARLTFPSNRQTPIAADLGFAHPGGADVTAVFDWRQKGEQTWTIEIETDEGALLLAEGGARLSIDGVEQPVAKAEGMPLSGEYPRLYVKMAALVARGGIDMDLAPMTHVADAFTLGERLVTDPFHD